MARARSTIRIPVIGVTGPIGSGKSTVSAMFRQWGGVVISGDAIGHQILDSSARVRKMLARAFGSIVLSGRAIDRNQLAKLAFADRQAVLKLNRIVHPLLIRELNRQVARAQRRQAAKAVIIDAALLVEWGIGQVDWDFLIGVSAPYAIRVRRLRHRGLTYAQIRRFSQAQLPWNRKRTYCDMIVKNDASLQILRRRARLCWDKMLSSG